MLSFHQVDMHMENCVIGGSRGEDALNVKNGKVSIVGSVFENGHADLVDLDLVTGTIDRCVFRSASQDRNGDGLDLSGSQVTVLRSEFRGLPDKGLSVGEGSQVFVQACTFLENILAIAVKDLSVAHVDGSMFRDNGLVFQVNRKKAIYGGAQLMVYTNTLVGNAQEREVDEHSRIVSEEEPSHEVREAFGIVPL